MACLIAEQFVQYYWCFDIYNCKNMLLDKLFSGTFITENSITLTKIADILPQEIISGILYGGFVICMLMFLYICLSKEKRLKIESIHFETLIGIRLIVNIVIAYVPVGLYLLNAIRS